MPKAGWAFLWRPSIHFEFQVAQPINFVCYVLWPVSHNEDLTTWFNWLLSEDGFDFLFLLCEGGYSLRLSIFIDHCVCFSDCLHFSSNQANFMHFISALSVCMLMVRTVNTFQAEQVMWNLIYTVTISNFYLKWMPSCLSMLSLNASSLPPFEVVFKDCLIICFHSVPLKNVLLPVIASQNFLF